MVPVVVDPVLVPATVELLFVSFVDHLSICLAIKQFVYLSLNLHMSSSLNACPLLGPA